MQHSLHTTHSCSVFESKEVVNYFFRRLKFRDAKQFDVVEVSGGFTAPADRRCYDMRLPLCVRGLFHVVVDRI